MWKAVTATAHAVLNIRWENMSFVTLEDGKFFRFSNQSLLENGLGDSAFITRLFDKFLLTTLRVLLSWVVRAVKANELHRSTAHSTQIKRKTNLALLNISNSI
mmetsp:Transcript_14872/g.22140  ORF Transcript_14872/g.22140 Transcript_14872/m.22140 type:complete len:103 (+) Transcript_14872:930-1238(+)